MIHIRYIKDNTTWWYGGVTHILYIYKRWCSAIQRWPYNFFSTSTKWSKRRASSQCWHIYNMQMKRRRIFVKRYKAFLCDVMFLTLVYTFLWSTIHWRENSKWWRACFFLRWQNQLLSTLVEKQVGVAASTNQGGRFHNIWQMNTHSGQMIYKRDGTEDSFIWNWRLLARRTEPFRFCNYMDNCHRWNIYSYFSAWPTDFLQCRVDPLLDNC